MIHKRFVHIESYIIATDEIFSVCIDMKNIIINYKIGGPAKTTTLFFDSDEEASVAYLKLIIDLVDDD